ncbi:MAG: hypothetical protein MUE44_32885 [Oscillatoriaceae cyanobacterium Prado104]|jgi:hypothetical protein|nr:hypothetical protein [Oscillatoriaceae cyanobacterium Prado104]
MNNSSLAKQLGRWNPQLLREFRGRLKPRTVIVAIALSAIFQVFLLLITAPTTRTAPANGWLDLWKSVTWMLPYVVFSLGSYFIVSDLAEEQKRGTLNFIRLSPRPAWQILLGKLLGVPVLLYLSVAFTIPLHFFAGLQGGVSLPLIFSVYLLLAIECALCFSGAMLCGFAGDEKQGGKRQTATAIGFAAIVFSFIAPLFMLCNINVIWRPLLDNPEIFGEKSPIVRWYFLPVNSTVLVSHAFSLIALGIVGFLLWRMMLRNFRKPRSTPISKRQSYAILAFLEVFALGFLVQLGFTNDEPSAIFSAIFMYLLTSIAMLILIFGICPQRQALLDWARYRSGSWQSLIWSDKSPVLLAVVIQLIIANALLVPWLFTIGIGAKKTVETVLLVVGTVNMLLIYSTFIQQVFATKIRNPVIWAIGGLSLWAIVFPSMLGLLQLTPDRFPPAAVIWTLFGYSFLYFDQPLAIPFAIAGIILQWLILGFMLWKFQQTMEKLKAVT